MVYFGIENNIKPEIGKYYTFIHRSQDPKTYEKSYMHIGECVENNGGYAWAMKDINDGKIYYPYCAEVLDLSKPLMSADWKRSDEEFKL